MLFAILVLLIVLHYRNRWYGYGPCWNYPQYRGYGPYGPTHYGYIWSGYAWQPNYNAANYAAGYGAYPYGYGYGCYRRPFWW